MQLWTAVRSHGNQPRGASMKLSYAVVGLSLLFAACGDVMEARQDAGSVYERGPRAFAMAAAPQRCIAPYDPQNLFWWQLGCAPTNAIVPGPSRKSGLPPACRANQSRRPPAWSSSRAATIGDCGLSSWKATGTSWPPTRVFRAQSIRTCESPSVQSSLPRTQRSSHCTRSFAQVPGART